MITENELVRGLDCHTLDCVLGATYLYFECVLARKRGKNKYHAFSNNIVV